MTPPEPQIIRYTRWLRATRGLEFDPTTHDGYDRLWRWSCTDLSAFWQSVNRLPDYQIPRLPDRVR